MWLGLQTVYSLERCPLFGVAFIERIHCISVALAVLGAPAEFQVVAVSATVVSLMWGPPLEYGNLVRDYIIEFHKHGEIPQQIYLSADTMHYAIVGLAPYTEYKFKVRAVSENGNGSWTSEVKVKTHEGSQL